MSFGTPYPLFLAQSVLLYARRDIAYLNNAKAGCSTIKNALIRGIHADHGQPVEGELSPGVVHGGNPLWSQERWRITAQTRCFTMVRNPFARVLSAYLDKIARKNLVRFNFLVSKRMPLDSQPGFAEFLRILDDEPSFAIADQHFRPQVENLHLGSVAPTRIYYMENFAESVHDLTQWLDWDLPFVARTSHGTGASDRLRAFYDDETTDIVRRLYADDFHLLGYSGRIEDVAAAPGLSMLHDSVDPAARRRFDLAAGGPGQDAGNAARTERPDGEPGPQTLMDRPLAAAAS